MVQDVTHLFSWQLDEANIKKKNICSYELSNEPFYHSRSREGPAVLIGDRPVDVGLEEREHGEPDAGSPALLVRPSVG